MPCSYLSLTLHSFFLGYNDTISKALDAATPCNSAKSTSYRVYQQNLPIYDGRYDITAITPTTAIPIQLFHPVFGHFLDNIANQNLIILDETLNAVTSFMGVASAIHEDERNRKKKVVPPLSAALHAGFTQIVNLDFTFLDNCVTETLANGIPETVSLLIVEDKREVGEGGSDPSTQAGLSMIRYWAQKNVRPSGNSTQLSLTKHLFHSMV